MLGRANVDEPVRTHSTNLGDEKFIYNFGHMPEVKDQLHRRRHKWEVNTEMYSQKNYVRKWTQFIWLVFELDIKYSFSENKARNFLTNRQIAAYV
jgi:hypothetical protein